MSENDVRANKQTDRLIKDRLALAFIVKDEGHYAIHMIKSVLPIVGFVSCVDTGSNDGTVDLIGSFLDLFRVPHKIEKKPFVRFDTSRNLAIEGVPGDFDWIFCLDADELVIEQDYGEIRRLIEQDTVDAWMIPRFNWIDKIGGSRTSQYPDLQGRLFRHSSSKRIRYANAIHEVLVGYDNMQKLIPESDVESAYPRGFHLHHVKLFQKKSDELSKREDLYRSLLSEDYGLEDDPETDANTMNESAEVILSADNIRTIHIVQTHKLGVWQQSAFWCEWRHPGEQSRLFESIIDDVLANQWKTYIRPGSVCIDIGAHSGDTTIPMALLASDRSRGIRGRVYAVEPNPDVYDVLRVNVELNRNLCDILTFRLAISSVEGEVEISDHGNSNCNGGIIDNGFSEQLRSRLQKSAGHTFKVRGIRLENFIRDHLPENDIRALSFIKIDCEGYDKEILRSSKDFLLSKKPIIQVEWFDWFTEEESTDLFNVISDINYVPYNPRTGLIVTLQEKIPDLMLIPG